MRSMSRSVGNVGEERPIRSADLLFTDPCDRLVGQVVTQVITFFCCLRRINATRTVKQDGRKLVHLAAQEPVEFLEATSGGPTIERTRNTLLPTGRLVTLAEIPGVVTV